MDRRRTGNEDHLRRRLLGGEHELQRRRAELAAFLRQGRELAVAETGTVSWYAFQLSETTFGVFDTFESEDGRQAHLDGQIAAGLGEVGPDLLARDPDMRKVDVLAVK